MKTGRNRRRGNAIIEFTLVGIPLMFLLISLFEISRGMWLYHTLAHSLKEGVRFSIVRGNNCNLAPNNCAIRVRDIAASIRRNAVGLPPGEIQNVTFATSSRTLATYASLNDALADGTYFPAGAPGGAEDPGGARLMSYVEISAVYPFRSAIAMFWPGAGRGVNFGTFMLPASSKETIQY
ncbi:MAG: pilus assembly protein [Acidobacteriales bacterium]|nr:MAG: pilus assembly protein [Terriglobales bacterium]